MIKIWWVKNIIYFYNVFVNDLFFGLHQVAFTYPYFILFQFGVFS